jgi:hypothetical protein
MYFRANNRTCISCSLEIYRSYVTVDHIHYHYIPNTTKQLTDNGLPNIETLNDGARLLLGVTRVQLRDVPGLLIDLDVFPDHRKELSDGRRLWSTEV